MVETAPALRMSRRDIYYWKCDRPAAFHGTLTAHDASAVERKLLDVLTDCFPGQQLALRPGGGQGNHITFIVTVDGAPFFARIEDGPEQDDYMEVESHVLSQVRNLRIPAPRVVAVDASRERVPFAWQILELIPCPDLNELHKNGGLELAGIAGEIGKAVARWQALEPFGFGPFDPAVLRSEERLQGFHARYGDYFFLRLEQHLEFLAKHGFLPVQDGGEIMKELLLHRDLLALEQGCLVHKDLALWNILGTGQGIAAFIDWDDAISGDPMDDLSLLACFHDAAFLQRAFEGYATVRPLPGDHRRRFWMHLLRNMIVKAVIRVGAGYFDRTDGFFLISSGSSGGDLKTFTRNRIATSLRGLREDAEIAKL